MRSLYLMFTVVAAVLLTGCGSTESTPSSEASAPAAPTPDVLSAADVPADARAAYLSGLTEIDPSLTSDEDRAIRQATYLCQDIAEGKDDATVSNNTLQRLSGGDATVDEAQAAEVVELAREHVCQP